MFWAMWRWREMSGLGADRSKSTWSGSTCANLQNAKRFAFRTSGRWPAVPQLHKLGRRSSGSRCSGNRLKKLLSSFRRTMLSCRGWATSPPLLPPQKTLKTNPPGSPRPARLNARTALCDHPSLRITAALGSFLPRGSPLGAARPLLADPPETGTQRLVGTSPRGMQLLDPLLLPGRRALPVLVRESLLASPAPPRQARDSKSNNINSNSHNSNTQ